MSKTFKRREQAGSGAGQYRRTPQSRPHWEDGFHSHLPDVIPPSLLPEPEPEPQQKPKRKERTTP